MARLTRTCARARWLARLAVSALLALGACSASRHTVGRLGAEPEERRGHAGPAAPRPEDDADDDDPPPSSAPDSSNAGSPSTDEPASAGRASHGGPISVAPATPDAGLAGCLSASLPAPRKRLDLYLMVDINISLPLTGAWTLMTDGLLTYVDDERAAGTGVGVDFFGVLPPVSEAECEAAAYVAPTVPVADLPGNAAAIGRSVRRLIPLQGSPMLPALEGALEYARDRASTFESEAQQAVVLITDGFVDLACGSDIRSVSAVAAVEMRRYPALPTYVIALDVPSLRDLLDPLQRFEPLDAIAREGGTERARRVDIEDPSSALVASLLEIQHNAEPCDYAIPEELSGDPDALRLEVGPGATDEQPLALERVAAIGNCGEGYYLNEERTEATLCPSTCDLAKARDATLSWSTRCDLP